MAPPRIDTSTSSAHSRFDMPTHGGDSNTNAAIVSGLKGQIRAPVSDYQGWKETFWEMGWSGLGHRTKMSLGMKVGTELVIMPFVQAGVRSLRFNKNPISLLLTSLGVSFFTTGAMMVYDFSNSSDKLQDLTNKNTLIHWGGEFAKRWAYAFVGTLTGMIGTQYTRKAFIPAASSLTRRLAIDTTTDFLSEPLLQAPAAIITHYGLAYLGLDQSNMTIFERWKMETMEGLLGTTFNRTSSSAVYHGTREFKPVRYTTDGIAKISEKAGEVVGERVKTTLGLNPVRVMPRILYHGTTRAFDAFTTDGSINGDLGAHFGSRYVAGSFASGKSIRFSAHGLNEFIRTHPDLPSAILDDLNRAIRFGGGPDNTNPSSFCNNAGWTAVIRLDEAGHPQLAHLLAQTVRFENMPEGGRIIPVYLAVKSTLRMPDMGIWSVEGILSHLLEGRYDRAIYDRMPPADQAAFNHAAARVKKERSARRLLADLRLRTIELAEQARRLREVLEEARYDSIIYKNAAEGDADSWMVLGPDQIHSAIGYTGQFYS